MTGQARDAEANQLYRRPQMTGQARDEEERRINVCVLYIKYHVICTNLHCDIFLLHALNIKMYVNSKIHLLH